MGGHEAVQFQVFFIDLASRPKLGRKEKGGRVEDSECAVVVFRTIIRAR